MRLKRLFKEPLKKLKKENLVKVAAHYGITPAVGATKSHILNLIKDHCVKHDIIDEVEEKPIAETAEIVRLKLDNNIQDLLILSRLNDLTNC